MTITLYSTTPKTGTLTIQLLLGGLLTFLFFPSASLGQKGQYARYMLKDQAKVIFLAPGYEMELPVYAIATMNVRLGLGYGVSQEEHDALSSPGIDFMIAPFLDVQHRIYINRKNRVLLGRHTLNNSGPFLLISGMLRSKALHSNFGRTEYVDFKFGMGFGYQQYKKKLGWSFSIAPSHYVDDGNTYFSPFHAELNIGYLLR